MKGSPSAVYGNQPGKPGFQVGLRIGLKHVRLFGADHLAGEGIFHGKIVAFPEAGDVGPDHPSGRHRPVFIVGETERHPIEGDDVTHLLTESLVDLFNVHGRTDDAPDLGQHRRFFSQAPLDLVGDLGLLVEKGVLEQHTQSLTDRGQELHQLRAEVALLLGYNGN